jgi:integrase
MSCPNGRAGERGPFPHDGRPRRLPPEVLTAREVRLLLRACGPRSFAGARNRAMIALMYRAGLRVGEALALRPKDVDLEAGSARVLNGKGGRARTVGLDPGAVRIVRSWVRVRASTGLIGTHPLLCMRGGRPLSTAYVRVLLPRLGRLAGIEKRVHAHGLRHAHAAELRAEGVDVAVISRQLGHTSILTTIRYLDHLAPAAVLEAMRGREWRA